MINNEIINRLNSLHSQAEPEKYDEFFEWLFIDNRQLLDIDKLEMTDIPILCQAFHDKCFYFDFMFDLVHIIEYIPCEISDYLTQIAISVPNMKNASEWAETLIARILNGSEYFDELINICSGFSEESKGAITDLLNTIKSEKDGFDERVDRLIGEMYK